MEIRHISNQDLLNLFINPETYEYQEVLLKKFKYFNPQYIEESQHFAAFINEELVGILSYRFNKVHFLNYLTVNPEFQNKKIGTNLIKALLDYIGTGTLVNSYYTEEGVKLISSNQKLSENYPLINHEYQNVKGPVLSIGDKVSFFFNGEWIEGYIIDFYTSDEYIVKIKITTDLKDYVIEQSPQLIKMIK